MTNSDKTTQEFSDKIREDRKYMIKNAVVIGGLFLLTVASIIMYYELRIATITGDVYLHSQSASNHVVRSLFNTSVDLNKASYFKQAAIEAGYTENAAMYLNVSIQRGMFFLFVIVLCVIVIYVLTRLCGRNFRKDTYLYFEKLAKDNEQLINKVKSEVEFVSKRNDELNKFIENIAHQVKTPLAALRMNMEMGVDVKENLIHIDRISEFIRRLLNISRMENGKIVMLKEKINVYEVVTASRNALSEAEKDKVIIECQDKDYCINGDFDWLVEALINIMSNCAEHTKNNTDTTVSVKVNNISGKCAITITDNGNGFDEEKIAGVFNRFESGMDSKSFHIGIGLNLSKVIIERHKGTISASNSYDDSGKIAGAEFRIVLPQYEMKQKIENIR